MSSRTKRWLVGSALAVAAVLAGLALLAGLMVRRFDPYIRAEAIEYLSRRFDCDVSIDQLHVRIPHIPVLQLIWKRGDGVMAEVTGEGVVLRQRGQRAVPLTITMKRFQFGVDLGRVFDPVKRVSTVRLEQVEIQVPPRSEGPWRGSRSENECGYCFEHIEFVDSRLVILPRDQTRKALEFELHRVLLESAGPGQPLQYRANLKIHTPPGVVDAHGTFGPWNTATPGLTPLGGDYTFRNADLGVFAAIAGTLSSKGSFEGTLSAITAKGEADVPDFRLREAGHPMVLHAGFEVLVDGANGNTILKPVRARIGTSTS